MNDTDTNNRPLCMFMTDLLQERRRKKNNSPSRPTRLEEGKQRCDVYLIVDDNARLQQEQRRLGLFHQGALLRNTSETSEETTSSISSSTTTTCPSDDHPCHHDDTRFNDPTTATTTLKSDGPSIILSAARPEGDMHASSIIMYPPAVEKRSPPLSRVVPRVVYSNPRPFTEV